MALSDSPRNDAIMATEIWACAACRSVNSARAKSCYRCRTPRDRGGVDASNLDLLRPGAMRDVALPDFQSPRLFAVLATVAILTAAAFQIVGTTLAVRIYLFLAENPDLLNQEPVPSPPWLDLNFSLVVGVGRLALALLGLTCWALWLSMAVRAMPALGLGYPSATGTSAFLENFYPIVNIFRVPAIVRDLVRRLHPELGRGDALIVVALLGLLGSLFLPRIGIFISGFTADSEAQIYRNAVVLEIVAAGTLIVGVVFLVVLMWWIDLEIGRRRRLQLLELPSPTAGASVEAVPKASPPIPEGVTVTAVPMALPARSQPAPTASPTPPRLKNEPIVGMPPIRALGITDAGATLPSRDEREPD